MAAVLRASTLGFAEAHDLAAFAWRAIAINPRFDAHPLVSERIAKRQADDLFTGLVDSLDERDWARIALHVHESGSD